MDENPDVAARYGIRSIPTLLVFKGGELVQRLVGVHSTEELRTRLATLLD